MTLFTPELALAGGALIGGAAGLLWLADGRIAGISGIVNAATAPRQDDRWWRMVFLLGLLSAPVVALLAHVTPRIEIGHHLPLLAASGLLVGLGTRLGSGCTSGHGVCGMARGSPRSITATVMFMAVAILVVFLTHHVFRGGV
jgi:uncharacterized membrane protein YedE/YeeE